MSWPCGSWWGSLIPHIDDGVLSSTAWSYVKHLMLWAACSVYFTLNLQKLWGQNLTSVSLSSFICCVSRRFFTQMDHSSDVKTMILFIFSFKVNVFLFINSDCKSRITVLHERNKDQKVHRQWCISRLLTWGVASSLVQFVVSQNQNSQKCDQWWACMKTQRWSFISAWTRRLTNACREFLLLRH